ncbi:MAG TPA: SoxR reducing system RseC family protein [Thermotogota bacterium]|nr:SoxR reducing system RseC family protein [Thermotogota bacterium]HPJ87714.1 SoxR reducing system RseC family protein [Thermotogota bacterium]HPR94846.1 SoxR reducing system RseC family protein [Thermotogota bacterium]
MKETAIVEVVNQNDKKSDIILKKIRPEACQHCNSRVLCGVKNEFSFKALNASGEKLNEGDIVEFSLPEISVSRISFIVYGIPLIIFLSILLFLLIPMKVNEYTAVAVSLVALFATYIATAIYDKKIFRKSEAALPKIIRKI